MKLAHYHRFPLYDYSRGAALFISISTEPRRRLFGEVAEAKMILSPFGAEVLKAIEFTFSKAPGFTLYGRAEYWRGIGAVELLENPMVSLRVSRRCNARDVAAVVERIAAKAGDLGGPPRDHRARQQPRGNFAGGLPRPQRANHRTRRQGGLRAAGRNQVAEVARPPS